MSLPGSAGQRGHCGAATVRSTANPTPAAKPSISWEGSHTGLAGDEKHVGSTLNIPDLGDYYQQMTKPHIDNAHAE
jgi:hypothetical protein